ncbi:DUF5798 family protein [Halobellus salinisoli]|uniref:DUF5798 family protein n=1 Tax=Halobellus salinisoli TaxID=3108500 RepID=UPI003008F522
MGLGSTAKKLQKVTDMAEDVYTRLNDLRDQVVQMRETTQETSDRVERLERESAEMRAVLEALAEQEDIDVESVTADAHITEAESGGDEQNGQNDGDRSSAGGTSDDSGGSGNSDDSNGGHNSNDGSQ